MLRLRTSADFGVGRAYGPLVEDEHVPGLYHMAGCHADTVSGAPPSPRAATGKGWSLK